MTEHKQNPTQTPKKQLSQLDFVKIVDLDQEQDPQSLPALTSHTTVPSHLSLPPEADPANQSYIFSHRVQILGRTCILSLVVAALVFGRSTVPDIEGFCQIKDHVQDGMNNLLGPGANSVGLSKSFQALSSIAADAMFLVTFGYWILFGKTSRLPIALTLFYIVRIVFLLLWFSPVPEGFFWGDQAIPSLLVYYEKDSGFYFSKYIGFITICTKEWGKIGKQGLRRIGLGLNIYLIIVSLIFRAQYSIDIFTAVFFADWCFDRVDWFIDSIDKSWMNLTSKIGKLCTSTKRKEVERIQIINI